MKMEHLVMPKSLDEALQLLTHNKQNRMIGGGAWMRLSKQSFDTLIALDQIGLDTIEEHQDYINIGAMVTLRDIETHPGIESLYDGILCDAVSAIMGMQIRNIATIGGSVAGKYSFSDIIPVLISMNARIELYPKKELSIQEYLDTKHMDPHIITSILLPKTKGTGYFKKVSKTPLDFSLLNLAITKSNQVHIVVGARPGVAQAAVQTEMWLNKQNTWDEQTIDKAVDMALSEIHLSSNNRAQAEYRRDLLKTYLARGLREVI